MAVAGFTVSGLTSATYPATPQIADVGFEPNEMFLANDTATNVVAYSFDGTNDAGRLDNPLYPTNQRINRGRKMWFRRVSGAAASTIQAFFWTHA